MTWTGPRSVTAMVVLQDLVAIDDSLDRSPQRLDVEGPAIRRARGTL